MTVLGSWSRVLRPCCSEGLRLALLCIGVMLFKDSLVSDIYWSRLGLSGRGGFQELFVLNGWELFVLLRKWYLMYIFRRNCEKDF